MIAFFFLSPLDGQTCGCLAAFRSARCQWGAAGPWVQRLQQQAKKSWVHVGRAVSRPGMKLVVSHC